MLTKGGLNTLLQFLAQARFVLLGGMRGRPKVTAEGMRNSRHGKHLQVITMAMKAGGNMLIDLINTALGTSPTGMKM